MQAGLGEDLDPGHGHGAEHHQFSAAEHGFGHQLQHRANHREQPQQHQQTGDEERNITAGDAGQLNHAVVLRERDHRHAVEHRGHRRVQAVREQPRLDPPNVQRPFHRLPGNHRIGRQITRRLQRRDEKITATGTNATQSKLKPYLNGTGTLTSGTSGIEAKSTVPINHATP